MSHSIIANAERIRGIKTFPSLVKYLRDDLSWPIEADDFEDLTYDWEPEELGIDPANAAKIAEVKQLRPMAVDQPWGIFFVKFEPKHLPIVALRRLLNSMVIRKRESANKSERKSWAMNDLMFISSYGDSGERHISFAHFSQPEGKNDLPTLKVLGWDNLDTPLHLDDVAAKLMERLSWPDDEGDINAWRDTWQSAFSLRHRQTVTTARELSIRLAELARAIRDRISTALAIENEHGPLTKLMKAFQSALMHDLDEAGFADMYAQTISYGLLSARIADPCSRTADDLTAHMKTNPFLKELMQTFLHIGGRKGKAGGPGIDFDELGVSEVVELLDDANMEAVIRDFGDNNRDDDPVIHFYEHFLSAYNKQLKIQRGVFYTPQPVVSYIIRRVHELLQSEFGLADGLADTTTWGTMIKKHPELKLPPLTDELGEKRMISPDEPFVQILDPATGTATFLVEIIDVIYRTLRAKWKQQHLTEVQQRDKWNDYVPKHLLPRLHAFELMMAPYAIAHMKIGLKLIETGYSFVTEERARIYLTNALEPWHRQLKLPEFDALAHEAIAVNEIKRQKRFTVIIGNPPYSNFGQLNRIPAILALLEDYKRGLDEKKINLDDDFIKFTRYSQALIERAHCGIFGFITNNVFLDGLTHRKMRQALTECYDYLRVVDLHGSIQKRERSPDGSEDENVFDIKQGVAMSIFAKTPAGNHRPLELVDFFGTRESKYDKLSGEKLGVENVTHVNPSPPAYFFKVSSNPFRTEYEQGWSIPAMMPFYNSGIQTKKDSLTIHYTKAQLQSVLSDMKTSDPESLRDQYGLGEDGRDWTILWAKQDVLRDDGRIFRVQYRPFDLRWSYFTGRSKGFLAYPRKDLTECLLSGSMALATMRQVAGVPDECEVFATAFPMTDRSMYSTLGTPYLFPLYVIESDSGLFGARKNSQTRRQNFAPGFLRALCKTLKTVPQSANGLPAGITPEDIFNYAYGVFHSPCYRNRYMEFLKIDFPRLPLPGNLNLFNALGRLGGELVALHLLESLKIERTITEFIGGRKPEVEKISWSMTTVWIDKAQSIGFKGVPEDVWNFHIGGYQVCAKWLKDRKGCTLSKDDITHYQKIIVSLSETIRLMAEIDKVIDKHGGWPGAFQTGKAS